MFELITIIILFIGTLIYIYFNDRQKEKVEKERFREFVIASKSKDITEYVQAIPNDEKFEIKEEDELIDLEELSPEELLSIKTKEYVGEQDKN